MSSTIALFLWIVGLYLVLRYRVHIHVNIETKSRVRSVSKPTRETGTSAMQGNHPGKNEVQAARGEVEMALVGLGCKKAHARQIAKRVCSQPGTFDDQLRAAIREAA